MKLQIFLMVVIFSLFSIASLNAEPTPSVEWLMNEPASLFDIGMMRLRDLNKTEWVPELMIEIDNLGLKLSNTGESVVYDFEKNILSIGVCFIGNPTEQMCADILKKYKDIIAPPSFSSRSTLSLTICFNHINYSIIGHPKKLDNDILKIIEITVGISEKDQLGSKSIFCSSGLFENTPSFQKFDEIKQ